MFIDFEYAEQIGTLTLSQPAKRNALSAALIEELLSALAVLERKAARVVIVRAARGVKTIADVKHMNQFCACEL